MISPNDEIRDEMPGAEVPIPRKKQQRLRGYMTLLLLAGAFLICIVAAAFGGTAVGNLIGDPTYSLLATSGVNTLLMFGVPGFLVCWWMKLSTADYLGLRTPAGESPARWFGRALILFLFGLAALNQTIWWNENLPVPDSGIWQYLREMEDAAAETTKQLLASTSVGGLVAGILVVGVLTGLCEELFFRGAMQKTFTMIGAGPHAAVWITAAVFSFMHFQFFGFLPRLLLGALLGYMMLYSGSVWVSGSIHALNNSLVVLTTWLANRGAMGMDAFEDFGVSQGGFPATAIASAILVFFILRRWQKASKC